MLIKKCKLSPTSFYQQGQNCQVIIYNISRVYKYNTITTTVLHKKVYTPSSDALFSKVWPPHHIFGIIWKLWLQRIQECGPRIIPNWNNCKHHSSVLGLGFIPTRGMRISILWYTFSTIVSTYAINNNFTMYDRTD